MSDEMKEVAIPSKSSTKGAKKGLNMRSEITEVTIPWKVAQKGPKRGWIHEWEMNRQKLPSVVKSSTKTLQKRAEYEKW